MYLRLLMAALMVAICSPVALAALGPTTRVAVVRQAAQVSLEARSGLKVKSADGMKVLHERDRITVTAGAKPDTLSMGGVEIPHRALVVPGGGSMAVDG